MGEAAEEVDTSQEVDLEAQAAEEQADFEDGYSGEDSALDGVVDKEEVTEEVDNKTDDKTDDSTEEAAEIEAEPAAAEEQPNPNEKMEQRIRSMESKYGELNSKYNTLLQKNSTAAAKEINDGGGDAPSKAQVSAALEDGEKYAALAKEFPEWGEAMKEVAAHTTKEITAKIPDMGAMREEIRTEMRSEMANIRDMGRLDSKHGGWEDTINSQAFKEFAHEGGPSSADLGVFDYLKVSQDPGERAKASAMYKGFIETYPEWGEKFGVLLDSPDPKDAIKLLDQFATHQAAQEDSEDQDLGKTTSKKDRLKSNIAATKSTSKKATKQSTTEHDDFLAGYKG